jgi:hypothetical protein
MGTRYIAEKELLRRHLMVGTPIRFQDRESEMKTVSRFVVLASALAISLSVAGPAQAGSPSAAASGPYCGIRWGSLTKDSPTMTQAPITGARTGRHRCFDRLVIDLGGMPAAGYSAYYSTGFYAEGSGAPLLVAGGAVITISTHAPASDAQGNPTVTWGPGTVIRRPDQFSAARFRTFRDLVFGGSYEGYSSFGLGVRARLPFRVFRLAGPDGGSRLVIDVAHRW